MISLKRSIDAYDAGCSWAAKSASAMGEVIEALDRYAINAGPAAIEEYRSKLGILLERLRSTAARNELDPGEFAGELGNILKSFRDRAGEYIGKLQTDLKVASAALCELLRSISNGNDVAAGLTDEVGRLRSLGRLDNLAQIRAGIETSASRLGNCVEQIRREKEVIIAQLQGEITTLQQRLEDARRAASVTDSAGAIGKSEFKRLLSREVSSGRKVGVVHVRIGNLAEIAAAKPEPVADQLRLAFSKNLVRVAPAISMTQWSRDAFCLIVPDDSIRAVSGKILQECTGTYLCAHDGRTHKADLRARLTCLTLRPNEDSDGLLGRLESLEDSG